MAVDTERKFDALNLILLNTKSRWQSLTCLYDTYRTCYDKVIMYSRNGQLREQLISFYLTESLQLSVYFRMRCSFKRSIDTDSWQQTNDSVFKRTSMLLTSVCLTPSHMSIHVSLLLSVCSFVLNKAFGVMCVCMPAKGRLVRFVPSRKRFYCFTNTVAVWQLHTSCLEQKFPAAVSSEAGSRSAAVQTKKTYSTYRQCIIPMRSTFLDLYRKNSRKGGCSSTSQTPYPYPKATHPLRGTTRILIGRWCRESFNCIGGCFK